MPFPHGHKRPQARQRRERTPEIEMPFVPGGFETAIKLKREDCHITISKEYSVQEWLQFTNENRDLLPRLIISSKDFDYLSAVLRSIKELEVVHLPFDKLFTQDFQNLVQKVQRNFPTRTVLVGSEGKLQGVNNLKHYSQANRRRQVLQVPVPVPPPERAQDQDINAEEGNFFRNKLLLIDLFLFFRITFSSREILSCLLTYVGHYLTTYEPHLNQCL